MATFSPPALHFPLGMDPAGFLREHWQKKPLALPAALPGWINPLDGDELAWLAGEEGVESRLVTGPDFKLCHGPFTAGDFAALGESDWTLLVQDVDKHLPDLAVILDRFDFLPCWRLDDLMISFAAPGGSVGPHVDAYDVFLLQAQGKRRWQIGSPCTTTSTRPGSDLDLVAGFEPVWTGTLEPGDLLYLPPGVPHHGVAVDAAMTWSIGFRAPSVADMAADYAAFVAAEAPSSQRYADPDLDPAEAAGGGLSGAAVERARAQLMEVLSPDQATVRRWLGCLVTEGKAWLEAAPAEEPLSAATLKARLQAGHELHRHPMTRWTHAAADDAHLLFVDGRCEALPRRLRGLAVCLCSRRVLPASELTRWGEDGAALELLVRLHADGKLYLRDSRETHR